MLSFVVSRAKQISGNVIILYELKGTSPGIGDRESEQEPERERERERKSQLTGLTGQHAVKPHRETEWEREGERVAFAFDLAWRFSHNRQGITRNVTASCAGDVAAASFPQFSPLLLLLLLLLLYQLVCCISVFSTLVLFALFSLNRFDQFLMNFIHV